MELRRQECPDGVGPLLFSDLRKKIGEGPDQNHVCSLEFAEFSGNLLPVDDPDIIFEVFFESSFNVLRIFHLSEADSRREDRLFINDNLPFRLHPIDVAQRFEQLKGYEKINL